VHVTLHDSLRRNHAVHEDFLRQLYSEEDARLGISKKVGHNRLQRTAYVFDSRMQCRPKSAAASMRLPSRSEATMANSKG